MIRNVKSLFSKLHNKLLLYIISFIGLSSATNSDDMIQPEYGVRIKVDYGPPQITNLCYNISGKVSSESNKPLNKMKVVLSVKDTLMRETETNEMGNYIIGLYDNDLLNKEVKLTVTDINCTDNIKYEKKDSIFILNFGEQEVIRVINFKLNEKRK